MKKAKKLKCKKCNSYNIWLHTKKFLFCKECRTIIGDLKEVNGE